MGNPLKQVGVFGLAMLHYWIMVVTIFPYWRMSTSKLSDGIYRVWKAWEGIWWRCTAKKQGEMWCDFHKDPLFKLDGQLQLMRALMCFCCVFSFVAVITSTMSLECVTAVPSGSKNKAMASIISAVLTLISGGFMAVATSIYAVDVYYEYTSPIYKNRQVGFEFGYCLYFGWVGSLVALLIGIIFMQAGCSELNKYREENIDDSYSYSPTTRVEMNKAQYV